MMTTWLHARHFLLVLSVLLATTADGRATDQTITLAIGTTSDLSLGRPFKTVLIGDPNVVDVVTRDDRSVVFEPLNPGATNVIFIDERSIVIRNVGILVCEMGPNCLSKQTRLRREQGSARGTMNPALTRQQLHPL